MANPEKKHLQASHGNLKNIWLWNFRKQILSGKKTMMLNGLSLTIFSLRSSNYGPKYINNTAPFMICCNQSDLSFLCFYIVNSCCIYFSRWINTLFQYNFIKSKALMHIKVISTCGSFATELDKIIYITRNSIQAGFAYRQTFRSSNVIFLFVFECVSVFMNYKISGVGI